MRAKIGSFSIIYEGQFCKTSDNEYCPMLAIPIPQEGVCLLFGPLDDIQKEIYRHKKCIQITQCIDGGKI